MNVARSGSPRTSRLQFFDSAVVQFLFDILGLITRKRKRAHRTAKYEAGTMGLIRIEPPKTQNVMAIYAQTTSLSNE